MILSEATGDTQPVLRKMSPRHAIWIVYEAMFGFAVPYVFADFLLLPTDLYYLVYFAAVAIFFSTYIKKTKLDLKAWVSHRVTWGILLALLFGALMVQNVLARPETQKFSGIYLAGLIIWRGLIYGVIDGLLLSSFPVIVTWRAFDVGGKPLAKKIAFGLLAWLFILGVTTAYHSGYSDFRSRKIIQPNIGNTIIAIPTLVTANPVASPITHAMMHIAAVLHCPETDLFLPPHRTK